MRVSLNLYSGLNYKTNFNGFKKDKAAKNIQDLSYTYETKENEDTWLRPAVIKYPWIEVRKCSGLMPKLPEKKEEIPDYVSNIAKLNSYIVNTSPHEEFDGYPSTYDALYSDYTNFDTPILTMKSPRQLVQYYTDFIHKVLRFDPRNNNDVTKDMLTGLKYKIDFEALGIDESDLSLRDRVKFAALFDFWSVTPEGKARDGYERPSFVRSPKEYTEMLLDSGYVGIAKTEGTRLKKRYIYEVRKADDDLQKLLNAEHAQITKERSDRPRAYRGIEPNKYLSPLNLPITIASRREDRLEAIRRAKELEQRPPAYDPNLDMAKVWHDFLGGDLD